jgi:hypothetical protein
MLLNLHRVYSNNRRLHIKLKQEILISNILKTKKGDFMPKKKVWTELLFSIFPFDKTKFWQQIVAKFIFLLLIWILGLIFYAIDGLTDNYLFNINRYVLNFGMFLLILMGSYQVQKTVNKIIQDFKPLIKMDTSQYQIFSLRLKGYVFSFIPCLLIALILAYVGGAYTYYQGVFADGIRLHLVWTLFFDSFSALLVGTIIWLFASIWLTIFLISRQELSVKLTDQTITKFRELSMFALWFGLYYFIGVSVGNISFIANIQALTLSEIVVSQYLGFVLIGIVGILLPFYNIHLTMRKMKNEEIAKISLESNSLLKTLDEELSKQSSDKVVYILAHLFSLQFKEKLAKAGQEWPIDISFLSKLIMIGLIPILTRLIASFLIS